MLTHTSVYTTSASLLRGIGIIAQGNGSAGFGGNSLALAFTSSGAGQYALGTGSRYGPILTLTNHQGVAHVVAGIAHVSKFQPGQLAKVLFDRQKVSQDLGGVELIWSGHSIPVRWNTWPARSQSPGHSRGTQCRQTCRTAPGRCRLNGFLFADLAARWVQIGGAHAQVVGGNLKEATGAGEKVFSKISATFLPRSTSCRTPAFFLAFSSAARSTRYAISSGV